MTARTPVKVARCLNVAVHQSGQHGVAQSPGRWLFPLHESHNAA